MSHPRVVVALDAGGTKTHAAVVDESLTILAETTGPAVSASLLTPGGCWTELRKLIAELLSRMAGEPEVVAVYAGVAGAASPAIRQQMQAAAAADPLPHLPAPVFDSDCRIALEGAIPEGPGILVIAGTGSSACARDGRGREDLYGGWGHLIGDEGSGYWIGMEAVRACVRAEEGRGPATALTDVIHGAWTIGNMREAIPLVYGPDFKSRTGALAPLVIAEAKAGDEVAVQIIVRAAGALVELVQVAVEDLALHDAAFKVAMSGSLWRAGDVLAVPFASGIKQSCPTARIVDPQYPAVIGAARLGFH